MTDPRRLLSVGLPVYNGLPYLERALESLMRQDLDDVEIVVCDNASTDGTRDLVEAAAAEDPRIRYHRNPQNIGGARNFNRAFELSRGRYFRWASADDFVSPGALLRCVALLEEDASAVLAYPETRLVDTEGAVIEAHDEGDGWAASEPAERFEFSLGRWGLANIHYGVSRSSVLGETDLLGNYPGSDFVLIADLATRGRFREARGEYFYRRIHAGATASLDGQALARFFDPDREDPFEATASRLYWRHAGVAWTAPVDPAQKSKMLTALARRVLWSRGQILEELGDKILPDGLRGLRPGRPTESSRR